MIRNRCIGIWLKRVWVVGVYVVVLVVVVVFFLLFFIIKYIVFFIVLYFYIFVYIYIMVVVRLFSFFVRKVIFLVGIVIVKRGMVFS